VEALITLDTGALIAIERRKQRALRIFTQAVEDDVLMVVPSVVVAEWWRARTDVRDALLRSVFVEHTDDELMKLAGLAQAAVSGATTIDAVVMASAARRGGVVYTSDVEDLERLRGFFPAVRVLAA
jgi:predicted nucleic acid-binding protein